MGLLTLVAVALGFSASADASHERFEKRSLSPSKFAEVSSGVVLIHTFTCGGRRTGSGSGFLIGDRIVLTARHVVDPPDGQKSCITKVRVKGQWVIVQKWEWWYDSKPADGRIVDLAVLKLQRRVNGYLFRPRGRPAPIGTNLSAVGHPLGNQLAINQGKLVFRKRYSGVPIIFVRLLSAQGASGSAFVDNDGRVVGILQQGIGGGKDIFGTSSSGLVAGLDLSSWWGNGKRSLCKSYPDGGIPMCGGATAPPPPPAPTPPPPPAPTPPPPTTGAATFLDATGDVSGTAPDLVSLRTQVVNGTLEMRVTTTAPLTDLQEADIVLTIDGNPSSPDLIFSADSTTWVLGRWNGSSWDRWSPASAAASHEDDNRTVMFSISLADLGNPTSIGIVATSSQGSSDPSTVAGYDELPMGAWTASNSSIPWLTVALR